MAFEIYCSGWKTSSNNQVVIDNKYRIWESVKIKGDSRVKDDEKKTNGAQGPMARRCRNAAAYTAYIYIYTLCPEITGPPKHFAITGVNLNGIT